MLLEAGRLGDATLVSVLAYAGLGPQKAPAVQWRHVRRSTLLVEQAPVDGELNVRRRIGGREPSTPGELARDLAEWRLCGRPEADAYVFAAVSGGPWRHHDWHNWGKPVVCPPPWPPAWRLRAGP